MLRTVTWPGESTPVPSLTSVCHVTVVYILSGGIHLENQSPQILNRAYAVPHGDHVHYIFDGHLHY